MGVFSFTCAKTNLPIISYASPRIGGKNLNDVVFYEGPAAKPVRGSLSEYGRLQTKDAVIDLGKGRVAKALGEGTAKLALAAFLTPEDGYATLGRTHNDPGQGGLTYPRGFVLNAVRAGGFASYEGLLLAFNHDVPIELASRIGAGAVAALKRAEDLSKAGYEEAFLSRLPGAPAAGRPGDIGRYSAIYATPLDEGADRLALELGSAAGRRKVVITRDGDTFHPDPFALGREAALTMPGFERTRVATFERDGDVVGTVTVYETANGGTTYVTDIGEGPAAYVSFDHALEPLGYDLPWPNALMDADPVAFRFFDHYGNKPESGTFEAPAVSAPRP